MKRVLSILFSLLMITIIVHPTLAMHFCGNSYQEINLVDRFQYEEPCCCSDIETDPQGIAVHNEDCCHTDVVSLDTDEFQSVASPSIPAPTVSVLLAFFDSLTAVRTVFTQQAEIYPIPPGVSMVDDVSLPFICIFRI